MAGNEGSTAVTAAHRVAGPMEWGKVRRLAAAFLVAFSMMSAVSVVFAGTTAAQTESDSVLQWLPQIQSAEAATGIPSAYIAAVIRVESGGDPNAVSSAGAIGLMQVMPYEFESQGISSDLWYDPATNVMAGSTEIAKHLASTGSIESALASYFGIGCDSTGTCTDGYISTVLSYAAAYAEAIGSGTVVDTSGVSVSTGTGTTTDSGTTETGGGAVDSGTTGDGSWQGGPPADNGGWQGEPPTGDGGWQGGPGGDPNWDGSEATDDESVPDDTGSGTETGNDEPATDEGEAVG